MSSLMPAEHEKPLKSYSVTYQRLAAAALIKTGKLEEAQKILPQLQDDTLWMWLGKAYADFGKLETASNAYGEAVKLNPKNKEAITDRVGLLHKIAVQYAKEKEWGKAGEYLRKAVELDPSNTAFRDLMDAVEILGLTSGLNFSQVDTGIPILEKIQSTKISRTDVAHQLAIFYHRKAIADENIKSKKNIQNWDMAFGNWALTLNDLPYWERWVQNRQQAYEHTLETEKIQTICQQSIPEIIKKLHGQYIAFYGKSEQSDGVIRHKQMVARLSLELNSARHMADTLDFLRKHKRQVSFSVACGPIMWQHFQIELEVETVARAALAVDKNCESAQKVLDALQTTELISAYLTEGLVDEAILMLENELTQKPMNGKAQDLLKKAYLEKMKTLVNAPQSDAKAVFDKAKKFKLDTSELEIEYAQQVLVKADQAYANEKLDEADKILRDGLRVATNNQNLKDKLADVANRQVKILFEGGMEKDPKNVLPLIEKCRVILLNADKVAGPNHPKLAENLSTLQGLEASNYNNKGVEYLNSAVALYKAGSRSSGAVQLKLARDALEKATSLQPQDSTIQENLKVVKDLMAQVGIY